MNDLSNDEDTVETEILDWVGDEMDTIAQRDFEQEAAEEDWDQDNLNDDRRFCKILDRFLIAMARGSANRIVQIGDPGDGVDAWCRLVFQYDPKLASCVCLQLSTFFIWL